MLMIVTSEFACNLPPDDEQRLCCAQHKIVNDQ